MMVRAFTSLQVADSSLQPVGVAGGVVAATRTGVGVAGGVVAATLGTGVAGGVVAATGTGVEGGVVAATLGTGVAGGVVVATGTGVAGGVVAVVVGGTGVAGGVVAGGVRRPGLELPKHRELPRNPKRHPRSNRKLHRPRQSTLQPSTHITLTIMATCIITMAKQPNLVSSRRLQPRPKQVSKVKSHTKWNWCRLMPHLKTSTHQSSWEQQRAQRPAPRARQGQSGGTGVAGGVVAATRTGVAGGVVAATRGVVVATRTG